MAQADAGRDHLAGHAESRRGLPAGPDAEDGTWTDAELGYGKSFAGLAGITIAVGTPVNGQLPVTVTR